MESTTNDLLCSIVDGELGLGMGVLGVACRIISNVGLASFSVEQLR